MLTLKCAACRKKLWKYEKIGQGEVLRCHKSRIATVYAMEERDGKIHCPCGNVVGIDKGSFIKMVFKGFTYSGQKLNK